MTTKFDADLRASINAIIDELYFKTADETYIVARWCSIQRLSTNFIWNAIHALEKYIKAALLINGVSVQGIGHDIEQAYIKLETVADDLLPKILVRPIDVELDYWRDVSPADFISRLNNNGGASIRYNEEGFVHNHLDLYLLDELVFQIRRLCVRLERQPFKRLSPRTQRDFLKKQPDFSPMQFGRLNKLHRDRYASEELKQAVFNLNMRFAPEDFDHDGIRTGTSASNSALGRYIVKPLKSSNPDRRKLGMAVRDWYFDNNKVRKEIKIELSNIKTGK